MTAWILVAVAVVLTLAVGAYQAGAYRARGAGRPARRRTGGVPPGEVPAGPVPPGEMAPGEAAERDAVFVSLARRLHSLVQQEIGLAGALAGRTEDPELRRGLLAIDHVATRMRSQTESLAVIGGAVPPRRWSGPVPVHELLRAAVAEVEHYPRVRIAPPVPGTVQPAAAGDIIHLVAELIDNATRFSPPQARTVLRAEVVPAGLAIDVEDRGPGLPPPERQRLNALLAAPAGQASGLLDGGRAGLFVVASLARRHGIRVELNTSIYGGIQAVVVLPPELAGPGQQPDGPAARPAALPGPAAPRPAVPPQSSGPQSPGSQSPGSQSSGSQSSGCRSSRPQPASQQAPLQQASPEHTAHQQASPQHASPQHASPPQPPPRQSPPPQPLAQQQASRAPSPGRPALPRRLPSSHLAPGLRSRPGPAVARPDAALLQTVLDGLHRKL